jgi:hypothetical protein
MPPPRKRACKVSPTGSAFSDLPDDVTAPDAPAAGAVVVTSVLQHRTRAILRTSRRTSSTPPTYSRPSPSHHGPTPNLNADHPAHRSSGPILPPASLHGHHPDQDHAPRYYSDVPRDVWTTTPYGSAPAYSGPSPDFYIHHGIHVGLPDSLTGWPIIPGVLRITPELIRTPTGALTLMSDSRATSWVLDPSMSMSQSFPEYSEQCPDHCTPPGPHVGLPGGLSGRQSIPDALCNISALLRLSSGLRHVSYAVSELWIRATILRITPMDSASNPDH